MVKCSLPTGLSARAAAITVKKDQIRSGKSVLTLDLGIWLRYFSWVHRLEDIRSSQVLAKPT
jgi:hypothetical protein